MLGESLCKFDNYIVGAFNKMTRDRAYSSAIRHWFNPSSNYS
jgi:hypothetical protein